MFYEMMLLSHTHSHTHVPLSPSSKTNDYRIGGGIKSLINSVSALGDSKAKLAPPGMTMGQVLSRVYAYRFDNPGKKKKNKNAHK